MEINGKYVVGIGEVLWDLLPDGKKIGGAPANFAYHVSQCGWQSKVVSAVGNDKLGDEIIANFQKKSLNVLIEKVAYPTGTVQIKLNADGIPCYDIKENVAWDNIPFADRLQQLALNTCVACFGSLAQRSTVSRETINAFLDAMPEGPNQYKIFDINLRQEFYTEKIICDSLQRCNVLKINDEELDVIGRMFGYGEMDQSEACRTLLRAYRLEMLILTCGIHGSYVFTPQDLSFLETPRVEVVDTVGAGDSFTAAFISSVLHGKTVKEAHRRAVDVSAYVCTQNGAMPTLPPPLVRFD